MPKRGLLTVAWLVAGVLAVALASAAVSRVGNEVTGSRPSPLSAGEVQQELTAASTTSSTSSMTSAPPETSTPTTSGSTTTSAAVPTTTGATDPRAETRTYALVGGTATLRFTPQGVTVVTATPNPGFSVDVEPENVNGVKVEFESDAHESRVDGWWDGGPVERVSEGE